MNRVRKLIEAGIPFQFDGNEIHMVSASGTVGDMLKQQCDFLFKEYTKSEPMFGHMFRFYDNKNGSGRIEALLKSNGFKCITFRPTEKHWTKPFGDGNIVYMDYEGSKGLQFSRGGRAVELEKSL